jgi:hypothetical protein
MGSSSTLARFAAFLGVFAVSASASAQPAPQPPGQPPDPWFSEQDPTRPAQPPDAPPPDGAFVQLPPAQPPQPTPPLPPDVPPYVEDDYGSDEGALLMAMVAARPFGTYVGEGPRPEDPTGVVAGHVGFRGHATGITDDMIIRTDLEGFLGASSEGIEGEGRAFLALGLAKQVSGRNHLMFRFGAGGVLLGNPVIDYQVADLPALELGFIHVGADGVIEIAPRVAMGVLHMSAWDAGELEPDPAPAIGGRILAGGDTLWSALEYEVVTGDREVQVGALTACFADKFSICLDGRLASASLAYGGGVFDRVTALSAGLSLGLGVAEVEH